MQDLAHGARRAARGRSKTKTLIFAPPSTGVDRTEGIEPPPPRVAAPADLRASLLASLGHDMKTPLTAVLGFSDMLLATGGLDDAARRMAGHVGEAGRALLAILNSTLDRADGGEGLQDARRTATDAAELARGVCAVLRAGGADGAARLVLDPPSAALPLMRVDAERLRHLLLRLFSAALRRRGAGRGRVALEIDPDAGELVITLAVGWRYPGGAQRAEGPPEGDERDKGPPAEDGWAACADLATAIGALLVVTLHPAGGGLYVLRLPASATAQTPPAAVQTGPLALRGVRVLVVDDNAAGRTLLRSVLETADAEVSEACDGIEAVAAAREVPFDVVLMDLNMPRLDGRGALERIRRTDGPNQETPILAVTAQGPSPVDPSRPPFQGFLSKPIDPARLILSVLQAASEGFADGDVEIAHVANA